MSIEGASGFISRWRYSEVTLLVRLRASGSENQGLGAADVRRRVNPAPPNRACVSHTPGPLFSIPA